MSIQGIEGFEGGILGNFCSATVGTVSVQASVKKTGAYALFCDPASASANAYAWFAGLDTSGNNAGTWNLTNAYVSFDWQFVAAPSSGSELFYATANNRGIRLRLNSAGKIDGYNESNVLVGTGTTVLTAGTWYRIDVRSNSSTTANYQLRINGVTEFSGTMTGSNNVIATIYLGKSADVGSIKLASYFDNLIVDSAAFITTGAVVKALFPDSNGSTMNWTAGPLPRDYTQVDDLPSDAGATYVQSAATGGLTALFGLQSCTTGGISGTILGICVTNNYRENVSSASSTNIIIRTGATNFSPGILTGLATYALVCWVWEVNPQTTVAWTIANIDALECGHTQSTALAMRLDITFAQVLYNPSQAGTSLAGPLRGSGRASAVVKKAETSDGRGSGRGSLSSLCKMKVVANPRATGTGLAIAAPGVPVRNSSGLLTGRGAGSSETNSARDGASLLAGSDRSASAVASPAFADNAGPMTGSGILHASHVRILNPFIRGAGTLSASCRKTAVAAGLTTGSGTAIAQATFADYSNTISYGRGSLSASCNFVKQLRPVSRDRSQLFATSTVIRFSQRSAFDRAGTLSATCVRGVISRPRATGEGRGFAMIPILTRVALCRLAGRGTGTATETKAAIANPHARARGRATCLSTHDAYSNGHGIGRGRGTSRQSKQGVASGPMQTGGKTTVLCRRGLRASSRGTGRGRLSADRDRGFIARVYVRGTGRLAAECTARTDYLAAVVRLMELNLTATLHSDAIITETAQPYVPTVTARPIL